MTDQKMIQRCQLSSAANCFLNSHREYNDDEPISMDHPTAPYYDGHNWKSAASAATELEQHRGSLLRDCGHIHTQMNDSLNRIDLGYRKAKRVNPAPQTQGLVQRGTVQATEIPAHLQTPFVLNPTPNRVSEWPRRFENSHLSEHTGRLGLPVEHDHMDVDWSGERLNTIRESSEEKEPKGQRYSAQDYHKVLLNESRKPPRPGGNGHLLEEMYLHLWHEVPQTMTAIDFIICNGTDEEKNRAENRLIELENIFRRNQLKRKRIDSADSKARKAQKAANLHREFKKTEFIREKIEEFECIKERGGEAYLAVKHHLSAVPGYMKHDFKHERQLGTGLWNGISSGNGVKRARPGPVWRNHDPHGLHSSLRMVSNASNGFQEEYVTEASSGPPTSINTVDGSAEPLQYEPEPEDTYSDEAGSDEAESDETKSDETKSDETKSEETKSDETKSEETKSEETKSEETKSEETKSDETKSDETKPEETNFATDSDKCEITEDESMED